MKTVHPLPARWLLLLPLPLLLLSACSRHEAEAVTVKPEPPPVNVVTALAQEQPMPRYLGITGELHGARQATLAPETAGKVVSAPIERGQKVNVGDIILKLDDRTATHAVQEAEAGLADAKLKVEWARHEFTRNESMVKSHAISALEFERLKMNRDTAETGLAAATARLEKARKVLDDMVLRAPFAGTVVERLTEVGEFVGNSAGIAKLVATDELRLTLNVPENAVGRIHEGQSVSFTVPAHPGQTFTGKVKYIGPALRDAARDLIVEAMVPNADGRLKPGMFAEGRLVLKDEPAVTVPANALRVEGATHKVLVVQKDRIEERFVEIGETRGTSVEIRRGVVKGESVVVTPGADALDGARVTLVSQL